MLTELQQNFINETPLFKVSSDKHLTGDATTAFIKFRDLISVVEEIFNDGNFKIEQSVSIDKAGIPRLVEFDGYVLNEGKAVHHVVLAQFITYEERTTTVYENDFIIVTRVDKVFFDKPLESQYSTTSKPINHIGKIPLYAKASPQPLY